MVAPSFQKNYTIISDIFSKNGRNYIRVKNNSTGNERDVRWYSDAEYAKAYGKKDPDYLKENGFGGLKAARGFSNGPILVIRGNRVADEAWLGESCARYAVGMGWYIPSTATFPDDAPDHLKYVLLGWEEFKDGDDEHMKSPDVVADIITQKVRNREFVDMKKGVKIV